MSQSTFLGYHRPDGRVGVRNHLAVISSVGCINEVTRRIAGELGASPVQHTQGCCQLPSDLARVHRVLAGIGSNPNVGAALVVGLGCEGVPARELAEAIGRAGKPVEFLVLQEDGGWTSSIVKGVELGHKLSHHIAGERRMEAPLSALTIGMKCGASDTTMGMIANPAVGLVSDRLISAGGTAIFCETTELLGAEHIVARRAVSPEVAERLIWMVKRLEDDAARMGEDMRGGQPTPGNMAGGITTIEEKSLGAACKSGSMPLRGVLEYGEAPSCPGLHFMDAPGREMEVFAGLSGGGAQLMLFATGRGAPQGFPITPVIKITANERTATRLREHIDVDVSEVLAERQTLAEASDAILSRLLAVASGHLTAAERLGFTETMNIHVRGPVI